MPALSAIKSLTNTLMNYGVVEDKAVKVAKGMTKAFPELTGRASRADFISIIKELDKASPTEGKKAARKEGDKTKAGMTGFAEKEIRIGTPTNYYIAYTTLPPRIINPLILGVMEDWIGFASGRKSLGGPRLKNPTGKYVSSITSSQQSNYFTVYSDSPYADVIETGLKKKSLKNYINNFSNNHGGKYVVIPITNESLVSSRGFPSAQITLKKTSGRMKASTWVNPTTIPTKGSRMAAEKKTKFVTLSKNSAASWTLPAYHPALLLWRKLNAKLKFTERLLK